MAIGMKRSPGASEGQRLASWTLGGRALAISLALSDFFLGETPYGTPLRIVIFL